MIIENSIPVYLRYPVMVEEEKKKSISWAAKELDVRLGVWFTGKHHPVDIFIEECANADEAVKRCINLPTVAS